ncbi:UNVERIFIED_CONTAM: hypothetical protein Slati_2210600 [Sesamum latifolium]|uniref:Uncharacterized protein n=1 Tax=Sesamum latifolium TaxID=2727402 RepID=A0AAW2WSV8_9LAMI
MDVRKKSKNIKVLNVSNQWPPPLSILDDLVQRIRKTSAGDLWSTGKAGNKRAQAVPWIIPQRESRPIPNTEEDMWDQCSMQCKQLSPTPRPCILSSDPDGLVAKTILEYPIHPNKIPIAQNNIPEVRTHEGLIEGPYISQARPPPHMAYIQGPMRPSGSPCLRSHSTKTTSVASPLL